jgi:hypothetical protein
MEHSDPRRVGLDIQSTGLAAGCRQVSLLVPRSRQHVRPDLTSGNGWDLSIGPWSNPDASEPGPRTAAAAGAITDGVAWNRPSAVVPTGSGHALHREEFLAVTGPGLPVPRFG